MLARENKKGLLVEKYRNRRAELKKIIKSTTDFDLMMETQAKLAKLPINSCPVRHGGREFAMRLSIGPQFNLPANRL